MSDILGKGEQTEEILRNYFLELGYFVVRSVKFTYKEFDVTDIDLFLYNKASPFSREKIIVDIKKKKTPQAIERIFWTKGLQVVLNMDKAIVATTDNRQDVVEFGKKNNVSVLDGKFILRIEERFKRKTAVRINEEYFNSLMKKESIGDLYGDWNEKYEEIKSLFLKEINFNVCNRIIKTLKESIEYFITSNKNELSYRFLYCYLSFFLISLDYSMKDLLIHEEDQRKQALDLYFKYGQTGFQRTQEIIGYLQGFLKSLPNSSGITKEVISEAIEKDLKSINSDVLAEYYSKQTNASRIFEMAIQFEQYAYLIRCPIITEIRPEEQSVIALFCDFWGIDRKKVL